MTIDGIAPDNETVTSIAHSIYLLLKHINRKEDNGHPSLFATADYPNFVVLLRPYMLALKLHLYVCYTCTTNCLLFALILAFQRMKEYKRMDSSPNSYSNAVCTWSPTAFYTIRNVWKYLNFNSKKVYTELANYETSCRACFLF